MLSRGRDRRIGIVGFVVSALMVLPVAAYAGGDANMKACGNEATAGFRAYLPDCRAYEMVSPPFKEGPVLDVEAIAEDGLSVLSEGDGAFAGTEADVVKAFYLQTRSAGGWVTSAITPPDARFPAQKFVASDTDLQKTLWALREPSQSIYAEDLYVRQADGSFEEVGPMIPPGEASGPEAGSYQEFAFGDVIPIGGSRDLSHVLFDIDGHGQLWPGDTTEPGTTEPSLYEYSGTGNQQPQLVGVGANGHLISDCGTGLGGTGLGSSATALVPADTYNALSASGQTVFFTAQHGEHCTGNQPPVDELYARVAGEQTVAISEPTQEQCRSCETTTKSGAVFQGASEDGTKAFFLTEQELLPGAATENLYEYDFNNPQEQKVLRVSTGSPTPEVQGVVRVSADGSHVYFVAKGVLTSEPDRSLPLGRQLPSAGANNLYLFERDAAYPSGRVVFIATLSSETEAELKAKQEVCTGTAEEVEECDGRLSSEFESRNHADAQDWQTEDIRPAQTTPDGRYLVFQSVADLTSGDSSTEPQVFEYDAAQEQLVRVSVGQNGFSAGVSEAETHASSIERPLFSGDEYDPTAAQTGVAVTETPSGSEVLFTSAAALTPRAVEASAHGAESVYEYRSSGSVSAGDVYLISDGTNSERAESVGLAASGQDVFFETSDPLLSENVDTQYDLYDAREGGGFPPVTAPASCEGEACLGATTSPLASSVPESVSPPAIGNLPAVAPSKPPAESKARPLTRAQQLAKALRLCHKGESKAKRLSCEKSARKRYGAKPKPKAKANKPNPKAKAKPVKEGK